MLFVCEQRNTRSYVYNRLLLFMIFGNWKTLQQCLVYIGFVPLLLTTIRNLILSLNWKIGVCQFCLKTFQHLCVFLEYIRLQKNKLNWAAAIQKICYACKWYAIQPSSLWKKQKNPEDAYSVGIMLFFSD